MTALPGGTIAFLDRDVQAIEARVGSVACAMGDECGCEGSRAAPGRTAPWASLPRGQRGGGANTEAVTGLHLPRISQWVVTCFGDCW
jgi:hypothetical protein